MMRFGFVTAVRLGLGCLEEIYEIEGRVDLLMTLNDDIAQGKSGRVFLDDFADEKRIPLSKVRNINDAASIDTIRRAELDWLFIIGWSQIARSDVLLSTTNGCVGMHPTLLPEGRGRASIPWAILKNLPETGVTMFRLDDGVDTGPIIKQERIRLASTETATGLYEKVEWAHRSLMRATFPEFQNSELQQTPQDEGCASEWPARTPADGMITDSMTTAEIDTLVRATTHPYPGAYVTTNDGLDITIWSGSKSHHPGARAIRAADGTFWAIDTTVGHRNP